MPKVTEEYIANKKKLIVDTAYALCLEKTVSTVTMQDIINRTGLSQGGIYRFYHDIDEIFADMILEMRKKVHIKEKTDEIFALADQLPPGEIIVQIFEMLADFMTEHLMGIEKVDFELTVLAMNSPDRVEKILARVEGTGHKEYIMMRTAEFFSRKMAQGEMQARVSAEELIGYISSAFSGVQMSCIVNNCYSAGPMAQAFQPKPLMMTLAKTVSYLLGVK